MTKHALFGGLAGTLLRVDLSNQSILRQPTPVHLFEQYLGARGVGAAMLLNELAPHTDPLGSENKLIFLIGPLVGTLTPGANKISVTFRSPLSETYSFSLCGGHLASELKFAGYDGLIIEGRANHPVYLRIHDQNVSIRDARHLWGLPTQAAEDRLREETGLAQARIAVIGPAGEKLVRFACIQADHHREFGRGGAGAVMGSKNLKGIAVCGSGQVMVADPEHLSRIAEDMAEQLKTHPKAQARREYGTPEMVESTNHYGYWATRNFSTGFFEDSAPFTGINLRKQFFQGDTSCYACPVACGKVTPVRTGPQQGTTIEGPEFETLGLLGPNCGISDVDAVIAAAAVCDSLGMDTMSAGAVVSMAMELYERGLLSPKDTGRLDLHFGNDDAMISLLKAIGEREGIGDVLAEGSKRAAAQFGAPDLAMQVKGQELATYEPRGIVGMGLSYAISPKGGHHMIAPTMGAEVAGNPERRFQAEGKAKLVRDTQLIMAVVDSLVLCSSMRFVLGLESILELYHAVTGHEMDETTALQAAERIVNLERLFNLREGFTRADDTLPRRLIEEPMPDGPSAGSRVPLKAMLAEYYSLMGWDESGVPTHEKLQSLNIPESFFHRSV